MMCGGKRTVLPHTMPKYKYHLVSYHLTTNHKGVVSEYGRTTIFLRDNGIREKHPSITDTPQPRATRLKGHPHYTT